MEPKVTTAKCLVSFELSEGFKASLFGDIESEGAIQYHYLLVVFSREAKPNLFIGSEWSAAVPSYRDEPVLGVFTASGHHNLGSSACWRDAHLFMLRGVEVARKELQIDEGPLTVGEAWALTQIMKWLNQNPGDRATDPRKAAYWNALSRNDRRLSEFLRSASNDNLVTHEGMR